MNVNFGLFPPIEGRSKKADRKVLYTTRAREALAAWQAQVPPRDEVMGRGTMRNMVEG
jgi:methylenetetrahydrofolate--tRNA-(uracil-5-)-methyltransferase